VKRALAAAGSVGVALTEGQAERLERYVTLLEERAIPLGMVAASDRGRLWERHIRDCLRPVPHFGPDDRRACDLGSGAGLPGLVLAIGVPSCRFRLVESRGRRAGFLELAADRLELGNVEIAAARAEQLTEAADVATARAFAGLRRSWAVACGLLRPGGRLIYFAGRGSPSPPRITDPEAPADVSTVRGLESAGPLVIMTRG
jgi:16S rRNA (guanine527-N7)-methyltransferase